MSEALDAPAPEQPQQVTLEDLQRMLDESNKRATTLERERDTERSTRTQTESQLAAERAAREKAETDGAGHAARAVSEAEQRYNAEVAATASGLAAAEAAATAAEEAVARHGEAGDWTAHAKAQRQLAKAEAQVLQFQGKQEYLETNKERLVPKAAPAPTRQPVPTASGDRYAQYVADIRPSERQWLDQRPKFLDDPGYRTRVFNASGIAATLHDRGSAGYFTEIERILGEAAAPQEQQQPAAPATRQATPRPPSSDMAPTRRAAPGSAPTGGNEITLSAEEVETANDLYGNPNGDNYIEDRTARLKHYHDMKVRWRERHGTA